MIRHCPCYRPLHHIARLSFDQCDDEAVTRPGNRVALPMTRNGAIFNCHRPFADRYGILVLTKTTAPHRGMLRASNGSRCSQAGQQFLLKYATSLDKQATVDRNVGVTLALIIGVLSHKPACDLLRRPFARHVAWHLIGFFLTLCDSSAVSDVIAMAGHAKKIELVARTRR